MSLAVNTNLLSLDVQRNLGVNQASLATSMQRLSSGLRINSAKDDAAGYAISQRFTAQIGGTQQASRNANDAISMTQTAGGALSEIGNNLQRMRDLAVQAANASASDSDRKAINNEVQSLAAEIDRVAQSTSFNGTKLLDGSFSSKNFQVGANNSSTDSIQITGIASARISALSGVGASTLATTTGTATTGALTAGALTLNGQQVGASTSGTAVGQSASSAFSIAAAINAVSGQSNVTATANSNSITGTAATAYTAIAADTFSINGVNVGAIAAGTTAAGQGANAAAAINQVAALSGVTAAADATTGALTLTAADGRDISIGLNAIASTQALAASAKTTFLAQTGLATGNVGTVGGPETTTVASGAFSGGVVSGVTTSASTYSLTVDGVTAISTSLAAGATGAVVTTAQMDTQMKAFLASSQGAGYSMTGTFAAGTAQISKTDGTTLTLAQTATPGTGGAITAPTFAGVGFTGATTAGNGALVAGTAAANHGNVTLTSTSANGIVYGGSNAALVGLSAAGGTVSATTTTAVNTIANMDVLTSNNALKALDTIDSALASITTSQAALGAYQNRFASVMANQASTIENLTASQSRIQDADFAQETANLSRAQVLQQAGTAMLAQANQSGQGVLSLLR